MAAACAQAQASGLIDPSQCTITPTATASRLHAAAQADVAVLFLGSDQTTEAEKSRGADY